MSRVVDGIGAMSVELSVVAKDTHACRENVHRLRNELAAAATMEAARRTSDRRWMVGTILTASALIIGAIGLIVQAFT